MHQLLINQMMRQIMNNQTLHIDLEGEESAEERKKQEAKRLKILTPEQMLSRLPISLA